MFKRLIIISISILFITCEGPEGKIGPQGKTTLIKISNETSGVNCQSGGIRIDSGVDLNNNSILDNVEIEATTFVCSGRNGEDGKNGIVKTTAELPGTNCLNGGVKIESGTDLDNDGMLDTNEIVTTSFVCNGSNGNNSLIKTTPEPLGANCLNGGFKIETGVDLDRDGILDNNEISSSNYVCNGENGHEEKQVRLLLNSFGQNSIGTLSTTGELFGELIKFDKRDYVGVDSIIFAPKVHTSNTSNQAFVELYNVTDGNVVGNSTLTTNSVDKVNLQSDNIYGNLPEKEIILSIRLRTSNSGTAIFLTGQAYLIMYRK